VKRWSPETGLQAGLRRLRNGNSLFVDEESDKEDPFRQSCEDDGVHQNRGGGTRIAASGFCGLGAEQTDAESGTEGGKGDVDVPLDISKHWDQGHNVSLVVVLLVEDARHDPVMVQTSNLFQW